MTKHRVVVLTSSLPARRGQANSYVWDLALLEAQHFDTVVLTPRIPGTAPVEHDGDLEIRRFGYLPQRWERLHGGAILENLRQHPARWLQVPAFVGAQAMSLRRLISKLRPAAIHAHWILPQGFVAGAVAGSVPVMLTTHGTDVYGLGGRGSLRLKRFALRHASAVTVYNREMRERLIALGGEPPRIHVVPLGAEVGIFEDAAARHERIPGRLLFVGRLASSKGVDVLLEAVRGIGPDFTLRIVGEGLLRPQLEEAAAGNPAVEFVGALDREAVAKEMATCEMFVLPSIRASTGEQEGRPLSLVEAMAAGCPIVASDLPGIDEVITHDVNGLLVPWGNAATLREAIVSLHSDEARRQRLAQAAAADAGNSSVESLGAIHMGLLQELIDKRNRS